MIEPDTKDRTWVLQRRCAECGYDAAALADRYEQQDPAVVGAQVVAAGERDASAFDGLTDAQRGRRGRRRDGASFTVDSFSQCFVHDLVHHRQDVRG